ncbi:MAG: flagellar basal body rod C-terminal domain-containing protein [Thermomicrobiales bacterium]
MQTGEDDPQSAGSKPRRRRSSGHEAAQITDRELDVAVFGEGFLRVNTGAEIAYTRSGSLNVDEDGMLVLRASAVAQGRRRGDPGPGRQLDQRGSTSTPGTFWPSKLAGSTSRTSARSGWHASDPQGLLATGDSLFSETEASGVAIAGVAGGEGYGRVVGGVLEMSNVDLPDEMTG